MLIYVVVDLVVIIMVYVFYVCRINYLGFGLEFLGCVCFVIVVVLFVGVGLYNSYLKDVFFCSIFLWIILLGIVLGFI